MLRQILVITTLSLALAQAHAVEAGKVIFASGQALVAGKAGAEGMRVEEGELLATGTDGFLYVKTVDNGLFILRPNTRARIVAYRVDHQNPANSQIKLELINGVARSKSGDAVKQARQNFRFNTPVAAIGVRGTDFTVYTNENTSRVAVLSGGVVVSGFAGSCRPEGGGPCEGAASRELFAAQRGQLIEVTRGAAPQLMQSGSGAPDQVAPPRVGEPLAKNDSGTTPILDARKGDSIEKLAGLQPPTSTRPDPKPEPVPDSTPETVPDLTPGLVPDSNPELVPDMQPQPITPVTPPVVTEPNLPIQPQLPERQIKWGRWEALADSPATIDATTPEDGARIVSGSYAILRTAGSQYLIPERGNASFNLKGGEAIVRHDAGGASVLAKVQNGVFVVDFGKASFVTSFDLINGREVFAMKADGIVTRDGRFGNTAFVRPQTNNMAVDGMIGGGGSTAGYVFQGRLDDQRYFSGVTYWSR